jgi:hypothetical protein
MKLATGFTSIILFSATLAMGTESEIVNFGHKPQYDKFVSGVPVSAEIDISGEQFVFSGMRRPASFEGSDIIYNLKITKKSDTADRGFFFIDMLSDSNTLGGAAFQQFCNLFSTQGTDVTGGGTRHITAATEGYVISAENMDSVLELKKQLAGNVPFFNANNSAIQAEQVFCGH